MGLCDSKETARPIDRSFYSTSFLSDSQCLFPQVFSIEFLLPRDSFSFLNSCSFFPTCLSKERSNVSLQSRWPFHPDQFSRTEKREGSDLSVGSKEKLESIEARGRDVKSRCKSIEKHAATRWTLRLWFLLCQGCRLHAPSAGTLREVTNPVIENQYLRSLCLMDGIRLANTSFLRDRNLWSVHRARHPFHRPPPFSTCSLTTDSSYPLSLLGIAAALLARLFRETCNTSPLAEHDVAANAEKSRRECRNWLMFIDFVRNTPTIKQFAANFVLVNLLPSKNILILLFIEWSKERDFTIVIISVLHIRFPINA